MRLKASILDELRSGSGNTGSGSIDAGELREEEIQALPRWRRELERLAGEASRVLLEFYGDAQKSQARLKSDSTPVTEADLAVDRLVQQMLPQIAPYPVVSEESHAEGKVVSAATYWVVDPLDGTQNFINRDDEFSIALGMISGGVPVLGVIAVPAKKLLYVAHRGGGAEKITQEVRAPIFHERPQQPLQVIASKLPSESAVTQTKAFCELSGIAYASLKRAGSAYKQGLVAEGAADVLVCFDRMWEWDIAAGACILHEAGCYALEKPTLQPLRFNQLPDRRFAGYFAAHRNIALETV